jgi:hypothetical protein
LDTGDDGGFLGGRGGRGVGYVGDAHDGEFVIDGLDVDEKTEEQFRSVERCQRYRALVGELLS